jgi:cell division protein FtsZ
MGILTVAVVTKPFRFEGVHRMRNAEMGIQSLKQYVDALVVVQNDQLNKDKNYSLKEAFIKADEILLQGIRGITDILLENGRINLDLADITTVMKDSGMAHMGIGAAKGPNRIIEAIRKAVYSPLLETTIQGASNIIINFRSTDELPLNDIDTGINLVRQVISPDAKIFFGMCFDENLDDEVQVTLIATGFNGPLKNDTYFTKAAPGNPVPMQPEHQELPKEPSFGDKFQNSDKVNAFVASTIAEEKPAPKASSAVEITEDKDIPPFLRKMKK